MLYSVRLAPATVITLNKEETPRHSTYCQCNAGGHHLPGADRRTDCSLPSPTGGFQLPCPRWSPRRADEEQPPSKTCIFERSATRKELYEVLRIGQLIKSRHAGRKSVVGIQNPFGNSTFLGGERGVSGKETLQHDPLSRWSSGLCLSQNSEKESAPFDRMGASPRSGTNLHLQQKIPCRFQGQAKVGVCNEKICHLS